MEMVVNGLLFIPIKGRKSLWAMYYGLFRFENFLKVVKSSLFPSLCHPALRAPLKRGIGTLMIFKLFYCITQIKHSTANRGAIPLLRSG
jgi:hypothetical protein